VTGKTAICPNCGAGIEFRWAGAVQTTCPACHSTLVRDGVDLRKVGMIAQVPSATSRIQLGTTGKFKNEAFEVIGRIVYRHGRGHWSEWHIRMGQASAWLSDAQGEYAVTRLAELPKRARVTDLSAGDTITFSNAEYSVASITTATYVGVEGELPFEYWNKDESKFIDLKLGSDGFGTIDCTEDPPLLFLGEYEAFEELKFKNLRDADEEDASPAVKTKSVSCTKCGAAIELRMGELADTVGCAACGSLMDATDPLLKVIKEQEKGLKRWGKPQIPLGAKGSFKGVMWTNIGYQVRTITVEGVDYSWREYLLWNADNGFRYLTEYEGHWNDTVTIKGVPTEISSGPKAIVEYLGIKFTHFQGSRPRTDFVLGEFPWEVRVGDKVGNNDYVAPPLMLSCEGTSEEITWSIGTYTDPERIREAFKLKTPLPAPSGPFANQPNPMSGVGGQYIRMFLAFAAVLFLLFMGRRATAANEPVFADSYEQLSARAGAAPAFVTRIFDMKSTGNVQIRIDTDLDNDWAFFNLALLAENGERGYELGREVSYYHGRDSDGSWSEGSRVDKAMVANVPAGRYYLRVDTERDNMLSKAFNYEITVRRDVPRTWPFLLGFLVLMAPAGLAFIREKQFEFTRWQESDYAVEEEEDDE
jgi:hypothetical protein